MRKKSPGMTVKAEEETDVRHLVEEESIEVMATNIKDKEGRMVKVQDLRWIIRG